MRTLMHLVLFVNLIRIRVYLLIVLKMLILSRRHATLNSMPRFLFKKIIK
jgi:hypothetical protein